MQEYRRGTSDFPEPAALRSDLGIDPVTELHHAPPLVLIADHPVPFPRLIRASVSIPQLPSVVLALAWTGRSPGTPGAPARRRISPRRPAAVEPSTATDPLKPRRGRQCITHVAHMRHGQTTTQTEPGNAGLAFSGEPAAAELCSGGIPPPPARPFVLSR